MTSPAETLSPFFFFHETSVPSVDRKSTRLNSSHANISYAVFCLKKKNNSHASTHNTTDTSRNTMVAGEPTPMKLNRFEFLTSRGCESGPRALHAHTPARFSRSSH